jgi:hypothetical protein
MQHFRQRLDDIGKSAHKSLGGRKQQLWKVQKQKSQPPEWTLASLRQLNL